MGVGLLSHLTGDRMRGNTPLCCGRFTLDTGFHGEDGSTRPGVGVNILEVFCNLNDSVVLCLYSLYLVLPCLVRPQEGCRWSTCVSCTTMGLVSTREGMGVQIIHRFKNLSTSSYNIEYVRHYL